MKHANLVLMIVGAALVLALGLFFSGYGYWTLPGWVILAAGLAGLLYRQLAQKRRKSPGRLKGGLYLTLFGAAGLASFLPHVMMGIVICLCVLVMAAGVVLILTGVGQPDAAPAEDAGLKGVKAQT